MKFKNLGKTNSNGIGNTYKSEDGTCIIYKQGNQWIAQIRNDKFNIPSHPGFKTKKEAMDFCENHS